MMLIDHLNELGVEVNARIPKINYGGCAVFALMVTRQLMKIGLRPRIILASYPGSLPLREVVPKLSNIKYQHNWNDYGLYFCHLGVEFTYEGKKYHYDSNGCNPAGEELLGYKIVDGWMRIKWVEQIFSVPSNWNNEFNRRNIPELQKIVENYLDPTHFGK